MSERAALAVAAAIDELRGDALASFGWTHLEVQLAADPDALTLIGCVAAPRAIARLRAAITRRLPGVAIDTRAIEILRSEEFARLPAGVTELWRRPDREAPAELVTELLEDDGPIERLARVGEASLVRALDGTLGWTRAALGPSCPPPQLGAAGPFVPEQLAALARAWTDVPYRLGGTRRAGVDCSALVQRLLAEVGARVPRHSADQLAIDAQPGAGQGDPGDIVAVWSGEEAPCHVGLALGGEHIVHASRSRGGVVVEHCGAWRARAQRLAHVPAAAIAELQRRAAGHRGLVDLLPLGRDD